MVVLDIEKAFDTINHKALLYKMIKIGFSSSLIKLMKSYLENRTFMVKVRNTKSRKAAAVAGEPQGSISGPLLFTIFVADMPTHPHTKLSIFAEDTAIRASSVNPKAASMWVQQHLELLREYFNKWKIKVNVSKCKTIQFRKRTAYFVPEIKLENQ